MTQDAAAAAVQDASSLLHQVRNESILVSAEAARDQLVALLGTGAHHLPTSLLEELADVEDQAVERLYYLEDDAPYDVGRAPETLDCSPLRDAAREEWHRRQ